MLEIAAEPPGWWEWSGIGVNWATFKYIVMTATICVVGVFLYFFHEQSIAHAVHVGEWAKGAGPTGMMAFVVFDATFVSLMLPGMVFTMMAGAVWGIWGGMLVATLGKWFGALVAFAVGRYACTTVATYLRRSEKYTAVMEALERTDWKIPLYLRLSPLIPYNFLNYLLAVTDVTFLTYAWTSLVGMIPGTLGLVYMGHVAGDIAKAVHRENMEYTVENAAFVAVSVFATAAFMWLTHRTIAIELQAQLDRR